MKIKRRHTFAAEVATSSMNDIMFFLLLFFLIVSTIANPNVIKVLVPKASESQPVSKRTIILAVTKKKDHLINKEPVGAGKLGQELIAAPRGIEEPAVVLYIPRDL